MYALKKVTFPIVNAEMLISRRSSRIAGPNDNLSKFVGALLQGTVRQMLRM